MGGISFCQKAGMGVAGAIVGMLLAWFGYVADQPQTPRSLDGIALMLTVIPGLFHALMGAVMFFYRITDERYRQIRAQILSDAPAA